MPTGAAAPHAAAGAAALCGALLPAARPDRRLRGARRSCARTYRPPAITSAAAAADAYERLVKSDVKYRFVIDIGTLQG